MMLECDFGNDWTRGETRSFVGIHACGSMGDVQGGSDLNGEWQGWIDLREREGDDVLVIGGRC